MAQFSIQWEAPEFEYHEKTVSWYWMSIIVAAIIIAFAVWTKNFLFGFFIVLAEVLFIVWGNRLPRLLGFTINEHEIEIEGGKFHLLKNYESVSIEPVDDNWVELIFTYRAKLKTPVKILFPAHRVQELRTNLKGIMREAPFEPTLIDAIERFLGF